MKILRNSILVFFISVVSCISFAFADVATNPKDTVSAVIEDVILVLKDPGYANPTTRVSLRQKIMDKVEEIFDFYEFSARTVGTKWKGFSNEQQQRFNEAFAKLLMATYLDNIKGYNGEKVTYTGEKINPKGDRAEVASVITLSDGKKTPINYRMLYKNDHWVVYDVIVENVSLIKNYRSQFKEVLAKANADQLIAKVEERAKKLAEKQ